MFDQLIESSSNREGRGKSLVFMSLMIHLVIVGVLIVIPLIYYQGLPEQELLTMLALSLIHI